MAHNKPQKGYCPRFCEFYLLWIARDCRSDASDDVFPDHADYADVSDDLWMYDSQLGFYGIFYLSI